jgi:membrane protein YdbS with pleckstrin-like domain
VSQAAAQWIYSGIWSVIVEWFRVPKDPPALPVHVGDSVRSFRPAEGFLRYLKLKFWVVLVIFDVGIMGGWLAIFIVHRLIGLILLAPALAVAILPDIVAYVAIHLRYDSTWYVMTPRSLRIRRGIWTIRETTITFENVQNVIVSQGPLERWFGISNVLVETAGGGGAPASGGHAQHAQRMAAHRGYLEGIDNGPEIRDMIMAAVRRSTSAGLGDERHPAAAPAAPPATDARFGWTAEQLRLLTEVRDAAARLAAVD